MKFSLKHAVLLIILLIFGAMFFSYADSLYRQYQRDEYKKELEGEIATLESEKSQLEKLLEYVQTDEYKELKAKENLGQKLAGETVVVVPPGFGRPQEETVEVVPVSERPPLAQWVVYFFGE